MTDIEKIERIFNDFGVMYTRRKLARGGIILVQGKRKFSANAKGEIVKVEVI